MALMKKKHWDMHNQAVNEFHEDAFQQVIIWYKNEIRTNLYNEDSGQSYRQIEIRGLAQYN